MDPARSALPTIRDARDDAVTTAALAIVRRALIEGVPVTYEGFARQASSRSAGPPRTRCARSTP